MKPPRTDQTERQRRYDRKLLPITVSVVCKDGLVHRPFDTDYTMSRCGSLHRKIQKPHANKAERRENKRAKMAPLIKERDEAKVRRRIQHVMGYHKAAMDAHGIVVKALGITLMRYE